MYPSATITPQVAAQQVLQKIWTPPALTITVTTETYLFVAVFMAKLMGKLQLPKASNMDSGNYLKWKRLEARLSEQEKTALANVKPDWSMPPFYRFKRWFLAREARRFVFYFQQMQQQARQFEAEHYYASGETIVIDNPNPQFVAFMKQKEANRREMEKRMGKGLKPDNKDYGIAHPVSLN